MSRLTDTQIVSFKKKSTPYTERDDGAPGLGIYVGASGVKKFRYIYRYAGKGGQYISFGTYPHMTLAEARERANAFEKERLDGRDPKGLVYRPAQATTLNDLLDDHLLRAPPNTRRSLRSLYAPIRKEFGTKPLRDVSALALKAWLEANYQHRQGSANALLRNLSAQFKRALTPVMRERWVIAEGVRNVVEGLGRELVWKEKRQRGSHAVVWEEDDFRALFDGIEAAYAKATADQRVGIMVLELCAYCGARPSEIAGLRWSELAVRDGVTVVTKERHKTIGRGDQPVMRDIIFGPEAVAVIERARALRKESPYVFPQSTLTLKKKGGRAKTEIAVDHVNTFDYYQKMITAESGFKFTSYNLRSAYINFTLDKHGEGMLELVAKNVGHQSADTTLRYYRKASNRRRAEAALAADALYAGVKRRPALTLIEGGAAA